MISGTHVAVEDTRNQSIYVSINDKLHKRKDAKISVLDSGYLVGDGVWEALRLHDGVLVFKEQHLDRLWQGARAIGMTLPFSKDELLKKIQHCLAANSMHNDVHVRIMITRGIKKTPSQDPRLILSGPNVVIIPEYKVADVSVKARGMKLLTSTVRRTGPAGLDPRLNCHSKLQEVQALIQAIHAGCDEALMLDIRGFVSTCNSTNFFIVKNNQVMTSTGAYCMQGITRQVVIDLCYQHGIACAQQDFSLTDVYDADEAFVTGTFGGLSPVKEIDGRAYSLADARLTKMLNHHYQDAVQQYIDDQHE